MFVFCPANWRGKKLNSSFLFRFYKMRKNTQFLILSSVLLASAALSVSAQYIPVYGQPIEFSDVLESILSFMWIAFCVLAIIMFVVAGILFLTALGDPQKIATARSAFIWGVVGILVAIVAYSVVQILENFFFKK